MHFKSETSDLSYWFPPSSRGISYFRKYVTDEKVSATCSSHQARSERKECVTKSLALEKKAELSQPSGEIFEILETGIGKQYAYMLGAYDTRSTFQSSN